MRLNRLYLIASGLVLAGLAATLAGCGGSSNTQFHFVPAPYVASTTVATTADFSVSGQLYASSPKGLSLSYGLSQAPSHGSVNINANTGAYTYTPNSGYTGSDSFSYTAATANGSSAVATASVQIDSRPSVSVFGAPVYVTSGGPASIDVDVRLSSVPNGQATVNYTTVDGTAKAGTDYTAATGTLSFGPGNTDQQISIPLTDATNQTDRYFYVRLSNPSSNLELADRTATVILRYWPEPLNDTGMLGCGTETNGNIPAPSTCPQKGYPRQDGELGRDRLSVNGTLPKVGVGSLGYDFTKIGFDGKPLFNQNGSYQSHPWACVRDNWTGLEWEVPTPPVGAGLYDSEYVYSWYNPDSATNGGGKGKPKSSTFHMDTYHFVQQVNQEGLCGHKDWRMPTPGELRNLFNVAASYLALQSSGGVPEIPTLKSGGYWTSLTDAGNRSSATVVSSTYFYDSFLPKDGRTGVGGGYYVILVRGGAQ